MKILYINDNLSRENQGLKVRVFEGNNEIDEELINKLRVIWI